MANILTIHLAVYDAGCLSGILKTRIQEVEQHVRICGDKYSADEMDMTQKFLGQMRVCVAAIESAKESYIKKPSPSFSSSMTLGRSLALRIVSVRLGNGLLRYFAEDKNSLTLDRIRARCGSPIDSEIKSELMRLKQFGKAAISELEELLSKIHD